MFDLFDVGIHGSTGHFCRWSSTGAATPRAQVAPDMLENCHVDG